MNQLEKRHLSLVASFGCIACEKLGFLGSPAELHHPRFDQGVAQRACHFDVIPLCAYHHRTGSYGEALHAGQKAWEKKFGTEKELLREIKKRCECYDTNGK